MTNEYSGEITPILEAIADRAARLCESQDARIFLVEGDILRYVAGFGAVPFLPEEPTRPLTRDLASGRAVIDRAVIHVDDLAAAEREFPKAKDYQRRYGHRTTLAVPLVRDDNALGVILLRRSEVRPFNPQHIELVKAFADQAAVAIENLQLSTELQARNAELTETLEQQTATAEILKVISSSPTHIQPVFDAIAKNAARLCSADDVMIRRIEGDTTRIVAHIGPIPVQPDSSVRSVALRTIMGALVRERQTIHIRDITEPQEGEKYPDALWAGRGMWGVRTNLTVPLLREGAVIGAIVMRRLEVRPFSDKQIKLVETFAAQAAIAIENVRLFNETKEALERQTATSEILSVISSSPTDTQPVFEAIVKSGAQLFRSKAVSLRLIAGDRIEMAASTDPAQRWSIPLNDDASVTARAIRWQTVVQVPDIFAEQWIGEETRQRGRGRGFCAVMSAPMLKDGAAIGAINVLREAPGPFAENEITLFKTFADQAVIAIENVRLFKELEARNAEITESLEQQTATAEILRVISSSPTDIQPVLDAVAESAARFCGAGDVIIRRADGEVLRAAAHFGSLPVVEETVALTRETYGGRAALERRTIHIHDISDEQVRKEYPEGTSPSLNASIRTLLVAPLLREDTSIGVITMRRPEVRPFSDKQIKLLETFAAQAAIAIENVRLFNETKEALEQQTATAEILKVISSSPTDIQPVLDAVAESAARLCGASDVVIRRVDGNNLRVAAHIGSVSIDPGGEVRPLTRRALVGRAILERRTIQVPDFNDPRVREEYPDSVFVRPGGSPVRTVLVTPLLQDDTAIGAIIMRREEARPFSDKQIKLLETFAAQAVIAIENVRLFNETKEALEQQTATAEILRVISSSPTDTQPVFDAIVRSGVHLFGGMNLTLRLVKGEHSVQVAGSLGNLDDNLIPLDDESVPGSRAIRRREVVQVPDALAEEWTGTRLRQRAEDGGFRAVLSAPMLRESSAIGAINVLRAAPGSFTDKEVALLQTFASQAVIAIENARLFNETKEALEQQTATAEVLKVISGSPTDTQPVFDAIVKSGVALFGGLDMSLRLVRGDRIETVSSTRPLRSIEDRFPVPLDDERLPSPRALLRRELVHVPDFFAEDAENWISDRIKQRAKARGFRSQMVAPMLRDGESIGVITVSRATPGSFTDKEIALLKTFADQAVIAIENVRLFNETKEALERQTATAEILKVISGSPTDTQPVFDAIVKSCTHLFSGMNSTLRLIRGDRLELVASTSPIRFADLDASTDREGAGLHSVPLDDDSLPSARAVLRRELVQVSDALAEGWIGAVFKKRAAESGFRSAMITPMLREGNVIGTINVTRSVTGTFTEKEIALLKTFADQAVIAIENVRLFNETKEALERQTATAEILRVISSSPTDTQPVFDAIARSGVQLFRGLNVSIRLVQGDQLEQVASTLRVDRFANPLDDDSFPATRAILRRQVVNVADMTAETWIHEAARRRASQRGNRAIAFAPMLRGNEAIGEISVSRATAGLFTDKEIALLKMFADQAVIAIENVRLFNETKEALEQQTVIGEILRVISGSPTDVQPVFDAIVKSGLHFFGGMNVSLFLAKGDHIETVASTLPVDDTGGVFPQPISDPSRVSPRAMLRREVVQVPDMRAAEDWVNPDNRQRAEQRGWRAIMSAPLILQDRAIGTIAVTRATPGPFTDKQVSLLKTFADQAVIAIENVRLFRELEARNAEVSEALKRQTATAEILEVISGSPTNVEPVFQAVAERAARICDATNARVFLVEGSNLRCAAEIGGMPGLALGDLVPLDRGWPTGRAVIEGRIMHIEDVMALPVDEYPIARRLQSQFGHRTILVVPLMRENVALGAILLRRMEVRPFDDKQVALLQTFAAQAVIAIENARLFNEIREKSRELESANRHKSEFLANMSHELRTPLNAIIGFSEALVEKMFGELNPKQEDYLRDIHSSGRHLLSLINDILDLSKIEAGRMELELSEFSVPMALKNAMSLVRGRAQTHGIALKLRLDPKLKEIRADERKFKQIVVNLLSNAVKFTPDGGHVQLNARLNRELLKISVKDDGIGIASKDQSALFEAFRQVGTTNATKGEGTGLGLALSRRFVELHGGRIELDSKPGKGSTFTFTLPVQPGTRRATRGKSPS